MRFLSQPPLLSLTVGELPTTVRAEDAGPSGAGCCPEFVAAHATGFELLEPAAGPESPALSSEFRNTSSSVRHGIDGSDGGSEAAFGAVELVRVGGVGVPAGPDDAKPGAHEDADDVRVSLLQGGVTCIEVGGPARAVTGVVREACERLARVVVRGPAEVDAMVEAGGFRNRRCAALSGGVVDVEAAIEDGTELANELREVYAVTNARQRGKELGLGMLQESGRDGVVHLGDGFPQCPNNSHLVADQVSQHLGLEQVARYRRAAQPT